MSSTSSDSRSYLWGKTEVALSSLGFCFLPQETLLKVKARLTQRCRGAGSLLT